MDWFWLGVGVWCVGLVMFVLGLAKMAGRKMPTPPMQVPCHHQTDNQCVADGCWGWVKP